MSIQAISTRRSGGASSGAVALHDGPFADLDQTFGALGAEIARRAIGVEGPIPRLPHPATGPRNAPSGRHGMIAAFTNQVSGEQ